MELPGYLSHVHDSTKWGDGIGDYVKTLQMEANSFEEKMGKMFPSIHGNDMISTIGFHMKASPKEEHITEYGIDVENLHNLFDIPAVKELNETYFGKTSENTLMTTVSDKYFNVMRIVNLFTKKHRETLNVNRRYNNITLKVSPNRALHFTGCCNLDDVLCLAEYGRKLTALVTEVDTEWVIDIMELSNVNTCSMMIGTSSDIDRVALSERLSNTDAFGMSVDQKKDDTKRQHHALKCKIPIKKYSGKTRTEFKKYSKSQPSIFIYKTGRLTILNSSFVGMDTVLNFIDEHITH